MLSGRTTRTMIKIEFRKWYRDSAIFRIYASFTKDRVWFGYWWASICSAHGDGYNHTCSRCRAGSWTRTRWTIGDGRKNSIWAFGQKLRKHD